MTLEELSPVMLLGRKVLITTPRISGRIVAVGMFLYSTGRRYLVEYWEAGEQRTEWLAEDQIEEEV